MANKELDELGEQVENALQLCDYETADELIGESPPDEYGELVKGMQAAYHMLWAMAKGNGMRQNGATLRMGAQALSIMLTLVHYAYALGVKRGREGG